MLLNSHGKVTRFWTSLPCFCVNWTPSLFAIFAWNHLFCLGKTVWPPPLHSISYSIVTGKSQPFTYSGPVSKLLAFFWASAFFWFGPLVCKIIHGRYKAFILYSKHERSNSHLIMPYHIKPSTCDNKNLIMAY